jgi:hypothetical protein
MRALDPRRIISWGVLLAVLCLVPLSSPPAVAKPAPWQDVDPNNPQGPKGDGDGVVVKAGSIQTQSSSISLSAASVKRNSGSSWLGLVFKLMRMGYSLRLYR